MPNPLVFFDVAADGQPLGRITFEVRRREKEKDRLGGKSTVWGGRAAISCLGGSAGAILGFRWMQREGRKQKQAGGGGKKGSRLAGGAARAPGWCRRREGAGARTSSPLPPPRGRRPLLAAAFLLLPSRASEMEARRDFSWSRKILSFEISFSAPARFQLRLSAPHPPMLRGKGVPTMREERMAPFASWSLFSYYRVGEKHFPPVGCLLLHSARTKRARRASQKRYSVDLDTGRDISSRVTTFWDSLLSRFRTGRAKEQATKIKASRR